MNCSAATAHAPTRRTLHWSRGFASLILLSACSVSAPPTELLSYTELRVRAAQEAGAEEYAPMSYRSAVGKLAQSRAAFDVRRYDEARRLAESAYVDAELAEVQAEATIMRRAADRLSGRDAGFAAGRADVDANPPRERNLPKE